MLVESGVIVSFNCSDVLQLWEVSEGVETSKEEFKRLVVFDSLNDSDYIFDLVAVEHSLEESSQWLGALSNHMLDLSHQLLLAFLLENNDFNGVSLLYDILCVIGIFEDQFELVEVGAVFELNVSLLTQESLSKRSANRFCVAVLNV